MLSYNLSLCPDTPQQTGAKRKGVFKRGFAPLYIKIFPLPYQGRGISPSPFQEGLTGEG